MDVHAHTHTARKKWTHYFWEFFMMFAAISTSFFVENQREHYIENKKERVYMKSLLADLKSDTILLKNYIERNYAISTGLDTLFTLTKDYSDVKAKELYRLFDNHAMWVLRARLADRTISQLKNAGGMRLIHVQAISDSILVYDERKRLLADQGDGYKRESDNLTDLSCKILDYQYLYPLDIDAMPAKQHINTALMFEFSNSVKLLKDQIETYIIYLEEMLRRATNLAALVQKKYHLK